MRIELESVFLGQEMLTVRMPSIHSSPFYRARHQRSLCHISSHNFLQSAYEVHPLITPTFQKRKVKVREVQ